MTTIIADQISSLSKCTKVALVEDNRELVSWLVNKIDNNKKLDLAGISYTYNGAFEMLKSVNAEVIILDLKLPDGSGVDILRKIRKAKLNIKILVLSMNIQASNLCLRIGADYFFDKSKDIDILLEKLDSFNNSK